MLRDQIGLRLDTSQHLLFDVKVTRLECKREAILSRILKKRSFEPKRDSYHRETKVLNILFICKS